MPYLSRPWSILWKDHSFTCPFIFISVFLSFFSPPAIHPSLYLSSHFFSFHLSLSIKLLALSHCFPSAAAPLPPSLFFSLPHSFTAHLLWWWRMIMIMMTFNCKVIFAGKKKQLSLLESPFLPPYVSSYIPSIPIPPTFPPSLLWGRCQVSFESVGRHIFLTEHTRCFYFFPLFYHVLTSHLSQQAVTLHTRHNEHQYTPI